MRFGTITLAGVLALAIILFAQHRPQLKQQAQFRDIVDLTSPAPALAAHSAGAPTGIATRIQAPARFVAGAWNVDQIPPQRLIGTLVVLDVRDQAERNPAYEVSPYDIATWERAHGEMPPDAIVVAHTGVASTNRYGQFPAFSSDALQFLAEGRHVLAVGTDTPAALRTIAANQYAAQHGMYELSEVSGLNGAPAAGGVVIVAPSRSDGAYEADARVLALLR